MSAATLADREVDWRALAALVAERGARPGYSNRLGRAYLEVDGTLVWADCDGVVLDPAVRGANAIGTARLAAFSAAQRDLDEVHLAGLTEEQRARELAWRRHLRDLPDPPQWQLDAYCDRHGIGGVR